MTWCGRRCTHCVPFFHTSCAPSALLDCSTIPAARALVTSSPREEHAAAPAEELATSNPHRRSPWLAACWLYAHAEGGLRRRGVDVASAGRALR
jgi:hypothetical protein